MTDSLAGQLPGAMGKPGSLRSRFAKTPHPTSAVQQSVESVAPLHKKQLPAHHRLKDCRLGLLINFGAALIKDGISRMAKGLVE
jgi:hypothetical protein